jgi:hypothetical protein
MNKVTVYGGLGNQMFQYALSVALNQKGKKTRLSISNYLYDYHHNGFNLGEAFKIRLSFSAKIIFLFLKHGKVAYKNKYARFFFRKLIEGFHKKFYNTYTEKREFEFDENVFKQSNVFFTGVWQVERYFKDIKNEILKVYSFNRPDDDENLAIIESIKSSNSVSLHIRRGDYLSQNWSAKLVVIKDNGYYENAINYINLKIQNCTYINNNKSEKSYIDMYLMSLCRHNIIANSSFSWWGAWLNINNDKIVVMPDKWFNRNYCDGIFPEEWIKVSVK